MVSLYIRLQVIACIPVAETALRPGVKYNVQEDVE